MSALSIRLSRCSAFARSRYARAGRAQHDRLVGELERFLGIAVLDAACAFSSRSRACAKLAFGVAASADWAWAARRVRLRRVPHRASPPSRRQAPPFATVANPTRCFPPASSRTRQAASGRHRPAASPTMSTLRPEPCAAGIVVSCVFAAVRDTIARPPPAAAAITSSSRAGPVAAAIGRPAGNDRGSFPRSPRGHVGAGRHRRNCWILADDVPSGTKRPPVANSTMRAL